MNKKTLFTTFLICVALFNCHDTFAAYCTGFGTSTRTTNDRKLNSFSLSDGINTTTVTVNQSAANGATVYFDKTATVFTTSSGAQITPSANWTGEWMHGYIWIDYNKDEVFTPKLGATGVPEVDSELVSYTCAGERNSKGESVSGDNTPAELNHLPFTIPSTLAPGNYRARFIVNWDNINPCLITSYTHGPCVVDFIITVKKGAPYYKVEFTNNYSSEWKLDWEENFNSGTLDLKTWSKIGGPTPGNNPDWLKNMSTYDGCFDFRDGSIVLKGIRNPGEAITGDKRTYLCGGIETFNKKDFMRGKIEIRAKHTSAQGAWPALWMMPQYSTYGPSVYSEIDISEHLNYENIIYQTLHTNYTMNVNKENPLAHVTPAYTNKNDYNTYGADMGKDTVKLMFNGIVTMAYPRTGAKDQFPFNQEYFLMLDMQLGGGWVGPVTGVDLPVEMLIDWVKFYKKDEKGGTITVKNGSTTINSGGNVREGDNITVKVNPSLSCQIDKVFVNGSDITNEYLKNDSYTFPVTQNAIISATYKAQQYAVEYTVNGGGTMTLTDDKENPINNRALLNYGQNITINFNPINGETIQKYNINGINRISSVKNNKATFNLYDNATIDIQFSGKSGIEEVNTVSNIKVYANENAIVITSQNKITAEIFNIDGILINKIILQGTTTIPCSSGIYLVRIGSKTYKIKI